MTRQSRIAFCQSIGLDASALLAMTDEQYIAATELDEYRAEYRDGFKTVRLPVYVGSGHGRVR